MNNDHFFNSEYFPSDDEIIDHFVNLNPNGSVPNAINNLKYILNEKAGQATAEGTGEISFGYIIFKYKQYLEHWNAKFGDKEEKWIGKNDRKRTPEHFLAEGIYNHLYNIERSDKDNYVLTKLSIDTLRKKLKIFYKLIGKDITVNKEEELLKSTKPKQETNGGFFKETNGDGPF